MKVNPVAWFEIYVKDMSRAKKFYQSVFNFELSPLPGIPEVEMWAFPNDMKTVGAGGALIKMEGFSPGGNGVIIYFASEDCTTEEKRVVGAGGRIQQTKKSIGKYGFMTLAIDTEGNLFGLHSSK